MRSLSIQRKNFFHIHKTHISSFSLDNFSIHLRLEFFFAIIYAAYFAVLGNLQSCLVFSQKPLGILWFVVLSEKFVKSLRKNIKKECFHLICSLKLSKEFD